MVCCGVGHNGDMTMPPLSRLLAAIAFLVALGVGAYLAMISGGSPSSLAKIVAERADLAEIALPLRVGIVLLGSAALMVSMTPNPAVAAWAGLVLGAPLGAAAMLGGMAIAVVIERAMARGILGDRLQARVVERYPKLEERIDRMGIRGVILVRLVGTPTTAIAWISALTRLRAVTVSAGCVIGSIPRVVAYAAIGSTGVNLLRPEAWGWPMLAALGLLAALALASALVAVRVRAAA